MTLQSGHQRVVAITGAGGVLGAAIARRLGAESGTALVLSDLSESALAETVAGLASPAPPTATIPADVSDPQQVEDVVGLAVERFGRLDVLISNAGVLAPNGRIHNLQTERHQGGGRRHAAAGIGFDRAHGLGGRAHRLVSFRPVLRHEGGGDFAGQGGRR
jgi:NAD(P)-dependent dehydrogenase (short-subunit alcohol dehydrogenase family)